MVRPRVERDRRLTTWFGASHWTEAFRLASPAVAWTAIAVAVAVVLAPWFRDTSTFGFHDWDAQTAHRYLTRLSLLGYKEFPWWDPFACGGFPAWGYVEGDTAVLSPWLPAYLALPMSL